MKFKVTLQQEDIYTTSVVGDIVLTKPFGLIIISSTNPKKESFFSSKIWKSVEMGDYKSALEKTDKISTKIVIDGENEYKVSKVEFDSNGALTLSLSKNDTNIWALVLAPGTFEYFRSQSLN